MDGSLNALILMVEQKKPFTDRFSFRFLTFSALRFIDFFLIWDFNTAE